MRLIRKLSLFLVLILFYCKPANQSSSTEKDLETIQKKSLNRLLCNNKLSEFKHSDYLDRQFKRFMEQWQMAGMSVAIVKDERLVYAHGFGYSDVEAKTEMNPGNIFRVASVSKLITAVGIAKLVENGKLRLDSRVFGKDAILSDSIIENSTDKRLKDITVRQLLAHSAGWSQRYGDPAFNSLTIAEKVGDTPPATMSSYYKFICSRNLHFTPGSSSSYSNMGYMFLGDVIAKVSGMPYEDFIRKEVLIPNEIYDMHIGSSLLSGRRENEVKYYEPETSPMIPAFDGSGTMVPKPYGGNPIELLGPAGGWLASSVELARLLTLIDGHSKVKDIVPNKILQEMICPDRTRGPLGWIKVTSSGDWWRTGSMAGTSAMMKRCKNGVSWVVLFNASSWKGTLFAHEINGMMERTLSKLKTWPEHDLFAIQTEKTIEKK